MSRPVPAIRVCARAPAFDRAHTEADQAARGAPSRARRDRRCLNQGHCHESRLGGMASSASPQISWTFFFQHPGGPRFRPGPRPFRRSSRSSSWRLRRALRRRRRAASRLVERGFRGEAPRRQLGLPEALHVGGTRRARSHSSRVLSLTTRSLSAPVQFFFEFASGVIPSTLRDARSHRERDSCATPISSANAFALIACGTDQPPDHPILERGTVDWHGTTHL